MSEIFHTKDEYGNFQLKVTSDYSIEEFIAALKDKQREGFVEVGFMSDYDQNVFVNFNKPNE